MIRTHEGYHSIDTLTRYIYVIHATTLTYISINEVSMINARVYLEFVVVNLASCQWSILQ
jgi:hypothetical protein